MRKLVMGMLALGVLLLASVPGMADVPADADYWWLWQSFQGNPVEFTARPGYELPSGLVPEWEIQGLKLRVPNVYVPDQVKYLWLEVKWAATPPSDDVISMLRAEAPSGYQVSPATFWKSGPQGGQRIWTWQWTIFPQPEVEWIRFDPSVFSYFKEPTNIDEIEIGTRCDVPEMGSLALASLGGFIGLPLFRRFRK